MRRTHRTRSRRRPLYVPSLERVEARVVPSFLAPRSYAIYGDAWSVAVGEFNGDGIPDLAVANGGSTLGVLLGLGNGDFQAARYFPAGGSQRSVAVGEFNGDGRQDLAVAHDFTNGLVSVLLGNGDGSFQAPTAYTVGVSPRSVAAADFNGDGFQDLATADFGFPTQRPSSVSVLLGNGDGTFQAARYFVPGGRPTSLVVGEFNADGRLDLAVANNAGGNAGILLGNGDGTFQDARTFPVPGGPPFSVAAGDFDGDGRLDLAVSVATPGLSVLLGNGDGSFQPARDFPAGGGCYSVAVGDLNRDGRLDLAVSNYGGTMSVLLGNGDGSFRDALGFPAGNGLRSVAVGDLNGDGLLDLTTANYGSSDVSILLNDGVWSGPVAYYWIYSDSYTATAGVPVNLGVFALSNFISLVPEYAGEVLFVSTDPLATTPGYYTFRLEDQGFALFGGGVTFRTAGQQALMVIDTATWSVFGFAFFDVQAPYAGGGAAGPGLDLFVSEVLTDGSKPARR